MAKSKKAKFQREVNRAVEDVLSRMEMQTNAASDSSIRMRLAAAVSGGYDFADTLHNIYLDYGYPVSLTFFNYWNMYRRFGVARRAVELYPDQTWLDDPIVKGDQRFNRDLETLDDALGLWRRLKGLDTRQRLGRYAGLFMRVRDNKAPDKPIEGQLSGLESIVDMIPLYESQLEVATTQDDPTADDFGMPTMYQYNGGASGSRNEKASGSFKIHPDRIIIASEDSDNSGIYGIPCLESVYNSLMDLRKVLGGGAEGFYKNAAQSIVFDVKDGASAKSNATLLEKFNEQYDEFSQNRARRAFWTPGLDPKTLDSNLIGPKEFFDSILADIAAGVNTPTALLIGNQTGRLAGDQDTEGFLSQVQGRRVDFGTDLVRKTIDWLIKRGILPSSDYDVEWPDAMAPSADKKLANAKTMSEVNKTQYESGGDVTFTGDEIREQAGYDPEEMPEEIPSEEIPGDDPEEADE